jgi:hypothetical protein
MATPISHADNNGIAGFEGFTLPRTDIFDGPGHLMADDNRHTVRNPTFDDFVVGMADTTGFDFDEHLIGGNCGDF